MIIIGAKGFAKEVLELVHRSNIKKETIAFFDNINLKENSLFNEFKILHSETEVENWTIKTDNNYVLGIGNPKIRQQLYNKFNNLDLKPITLISEFSTIGNFNNRIGIASIICAGVKITNDIEIGIGCLINLNVTIGHDCVIGDFVEICPGTNISGNCTIENNVFIGTGAILNPGVRIGTGAIIASGTVVINDIPPNVTAYGVPAKIKHS